MAQLKLVTGLAVLAVALGTIGAAIGLADVVSRAEVGAAAAAVVAVMLVVVAIGATRHRRRNPYW